jgi:hypothetical protein
MVAPTQSMPEFGTQCLSLSLGLPCQSFLGILCKAKLGHISLVPVPFSFSGFGNQFILPFIWNNKTLISKVWLSFAFAFDFHLLRRFYEFSLVLEKPSDKFLVFQKYAKHVLWLVNGFNLCSVI